MNIANPRSVADIEGFVGLLKATGEDGQVNATLERLRAMPDAQRQGVVHTRVSGPVIAEAPCGFSIAFGRLMDDAVAKHAYKVIFQCRGAEAGDV